jgi:hypothetical protein
MEIHGGVQGQELAAHWRGLELAPDGGAHAGGAPIEADRELAERPHRPRRRRRRRPRRRPGPPVAAS